MMQLSKESCAMTLFEKPASLTEMLSVEEQREEAWGVPIGRMLTAR
jgi:hypothetical protein